MSNPEPPPGSGISVRMTPKQCTDLLERLRDDDTFRKKVVSDPNAALAPYGIEISEQLLGSEIKLPTPEKIQGILDCIGSKRSKAPLGALPYNIFGVFEIFMASAGGGFKSLPETKPKGRTKIGEPIDIPPRKEKPFRRPYRRSSE